MLRSGLFGSIRAPRGPNANPKTTTSRTAFFGFFLEKAIFSSATVYFYEKNISVRFERNLRQNAQKKDQKAPSKNEFRGGFLPF